MNWDNISTYTSASFRRPLTLEDIEKARFASMVALQKNKAKEAAMDFQLAMEYGPDALMPRDQWPIGGISVNLDSEDGRRLAESIKKYLKR